MRVLTDIFFQLLRDFLVQRPNDSPLIVRCLILVEEWINAETFDLLVSKLDLKLLCVSQETT